MLQWFLNFLNRPKINYKSIKISNIKYKPKKSGYYLISLTDSKDFELTIVNHEVYNWVMDKNAKVPSSFRSILEVNPLQFDEPNDRALFLSSIEPSGINGDVVASFFSILELGNYISSNKLLIREEFEGYIY